ncbi:adenosylhomocysteinase [Candidatus Caldarchaeum subterraneum]|uniref:Adenosylhomocysteinase n=2 Tax=Caldiarchaeum subterraneum TaxID=311458 RepID=E6P8V4_CALS0|nr:adenosylhomocysteinase [Candidatus Caldarchaeum subterraneum]
MTEPFHVKDLSLAEKGASRIMLAESMMPVLSLLRRKYADEKPFEGYRVSMCLHVTKETAVLCRVLREGGAKVALCASNPLSTQDDVAAALAVEGFNVYAFRGMSTQEYYGALGKVLSHGPHLLVDDGADLITSLHRLIHGLPDVHLEDVRRGMDGADVPRVWGATEETTTGVTRLRALDGEGLLAFPVIAVNDALSKSLFDNPLGTGQSALDGVLRATNLLLAGKTVVVAGYGRVGAGIAERAKGMGARVVVVEPDPIKALQAYMNGFTVTSMSKASEIGDVFITATGNIDVIRGEHFEKMKDGVFLANAGHMDVEINKQDLKQLAVSVETIRENVTLYRLRNGRKLFLLADGRLVNLVCAEGHPSEVMDLSFSLQAESLRYLIKNVEKLGKHVYTVPREIDEAVAALKLAAFGVELEKLTPRQLDYMRSWMAGT